MTSWRMQLHPNSSGGSAKHSAESLSAGFIGLDFKQDVGDLMRAAYDDLPQPEKYQWAFAHEMTEGDWVLIFSHHYPFALVRVAGPYNYMRSCESEIGVWFRHFRRVDSVHYYADYKKDPNQWTKLVMTSTLTPLRSSDSGSQRLIDEWIAVAEAVDSE